MDHKLVLVQPFFVCLSSRSDVHPHMHRVNMLDWLVLTDFRTDLGQDLHLQGHADVRDLVVQIPHGLDPLLAVCQLILIDRLLVDSQLARYSVWKAGLLRR